MHYFNGHYYELADTALGWAAANTAASGYTYLTAKGHLVSITSSAENDFLRSIFATGWIGANDLAVNGVFRWISGGPDNNTVLNNSTYLNWEPTNPKNTSGYDCVQLNGATASSCIGCWTTAPCTTPVLPFIVEYECNTGYEFNATGCQGHCVICG